MKTSRVSTLLAVLAFGSIAALLSTPASALPPPPFSDISAGLTAVDDSSVAWGDYDADGDLDILLTGNKGNGTSEIWENNDGASFSKHATLATQVYFGSAAWGDYDTDGDLDVLLSGMSNSLVPVTQIFENAAGVFSRDAGADAGLPAVWHGSVAWGDYNADGKPDILITGNPVYPGTPAPISKIYKNDGDGTFSEVPGTSLAPVFYGSVAWGDYNSDGFPDILLTGSASTGSVSKIYRNNGNGTFSEDTTADSSLAGVSFGSAAWGDYSADGRLDILLTGMSGSSSVSNLYQNNSDGTFSEDTAADASLTGVEWSSVAWGDFGNRLEGGSPDGRLDILLTGNGTTFYSAVYERSTEIVVTNDPPSAPSGLSASFASGIETLSWNAATDSEQTGGPNGLTYNVRVGTNPGASNVVSPLALANGTRLVPQFGNAGERTSYKLSGLTHGQTYYWSVQAVDNGFAGSSFAAEGSFVANNAPTASAGGPYAITEGQQLQLSGSASDPEGDGMTYLWKINGQGGFTSESPTIAWSTLESMGLGDGTASLTASLQVTDSYGASSTGSATVTLNNAVPTAAISGSSALFVGEEGSWTLSATDPSAADLAGSFKYEIDWNGDGSVDQTVSAGHSTNVSHTFSGTGSKTVTVTATDKNGGKSAKVAKSVTVMPGPTESLPAGKIASGKIASAKLSKKTFTATQAKKVKLTVKFSPKSKALKWAITLKHGKKWLAVKSAKKTSPAKTCTMTVKQLFSGKKMKKGAYKLKLSADRNSKTLTFTIK